MPDARLYSPRAPEHGSDPSGPALGDPQSRLAQSVLPWEPCDDELGALPSAG